MLICLYLRDMLMSVSGITYAMFIQFILTFLLLYFRFLVVFNTKYFKQIRQVYLLSPLKKGCYISSIWLAVNETRMSIKEKGVDVDDMEVPK